MNPEAIEAAARAAHEAAGLEWTDGKDWREDCARIEAKAALEAAAPYLIREARAEGWDEAIEFMGQASSSAFYAQMLRFEAHKRYGADRAAAIRAGDK